MAAKDRSIYDIFTIKSNDGDKTIDLRGGVVSFSYFENVFSPMITAQVLITVTGNVITDEDGDVVSIYNGLPLRGCLLYTSPSPRDATLSRMPSSA